MKTTTSLHIDLDRLRERPYEWTAAVDRPAEVWPELELELAGAARVRARATRAVGGDVHVRGRLEATLRLACRRCLAALERGLEVPLELWFHEGAEPGEEREGRGGRQVVYPLAPGARHLDLTYVLRDELALAAPAYPVCREACAGLCPGCGARLDEEPCGCAPPEGDPRWAPLRALREGENLPGEA